MKRLLTFAYTLLTSTFLFAQSGLPSTIANGVEFKVIKCQGDRSTNSVKVKFSMHNKEELPVEMMTLFNLTFTDSNGDQYLPFDKANLRIFAWQKTNISGWSNFQDVPSGPPVNSDEITIKRVSSKVNSFSQVTVVFRRHPSKGLADYIVKIDNVPIVWQ